MPTRSEDQSFAELMQTNVTMSTASLDEAIDWIKTNMNPEQVFDDNDLENWAEKNGYIKGD